MFCLADLCSSLSSDIAYPTVSPSEFFTLYKKAIQLFSPNIRGIGFVHSPLGFQPILNPHVSISQSGCRFLIELFSVTSSGFEVKVFTGCWLTNNTSLALSICTRSSDIHCLISTRVRIVSSLWISGSHSDARESSLRGEAVFHQPRALGSLGFSVPITAVQFQPTCLSTSRKAGKLSSAVHSVGISLPDTECSAGTC